MFRAQSQLYQKYNPTIMTQRQRVASLCTSYFLRAEPNPITLFFIAVKITQRGDINTKYIVTQYSTDLPPQRG